MRYAICFPATVRGGRRAETGRRISGRWFDSTRNCSGDTALPEADRDVVGAKAQPEIHSVRPLIVVLEIAAIVLAGVEGEDTVSHGRHLAAGAQIGHITSVLSEHVTVGSRRVVVGSGRKRPAAEGPKIKNYKRHI